MYVVGLIVPQNILFVNYFYTFLTIYFQFYHKNYLFSLNRHVFLNFFYLSLVTIDKKGIPAVLLVMRYRFAEPFHG